MEFLSFASAVEAAYMKPRAAPTDRQDDERQNYESEELDAVHGSNLFKIHLALICRPTATPSQIEVPVRIDASGVLADAVV
jgi:hypothetical protein